MVRLFYALFMLSEGKTLKLEKIEIGIPFKGTVA